MLSRNVALMWRVSLAPQPVMSVLLSLAPVVTSETTHLALLHTSRRSWPRATLFTRESSLPSELTLNSGARGFGSHDFRWRARTLRQLVCSSTIVRTKHPCPRFVWGFSPKVARRRSAAADGYATATGASESVHPRKAPKNNIHALTWPRVAPLTVLLLQCECRSKRARENGRVHGESSRVHRGQQRNSFCPASATFAQIGGLLSADPEAIRFSAQQQ